MTSENLNAPLRKPSAIRRIGGFIANPLSLLTGLFTGGLVTLCLWLLVTDDPLGGQPVAMLAIDQQQVASTDKDADALEIRDGLPPENNEDVTEPVAAAEPAVEDTGPEPLDRQLDQIASDTPNKSVALKTAPIKGLAEPTSNGLLPRISANGNTPAKLYARPVSKQQSNPDVAKIAIMVSGMGLSALSTSVAVNRLPPEVTLAFAPYAKGLQEWVHKARQNGHEVMLQLPMEPYDYPDNDPGPHTLLSSLPPQDNVRRLEWLLGRFTGYFGVTNYMGAKFTASPDALRPILRQVARRGLHYMEDGSSARSTSAKIAREINLTASSADIIVDNTPNAAGIDAALARLETVALERGVAVGVASGLPVTMQQLIKWSKTLKQKGIILVPVSATIALRQNLS